MRDLLFIVWIATLGVTRLDLTGGAVDFLVTPFLVLSLILIVIEGGTTAGRGGKFELPGNAVPYFLLITTLIGVILLSTFLSEEAETAGRRSALLLVQVYMVFLGALALANRPDPRWLLLRGAYLGLALSLFFNLLQVLAWFGAVPSGAALAGVVNLEVSNYAGLIPRLTGAAHDPNLGGILILTYLYVVVRLGRRSPVRAALVTLGVLSVVLTLSRSAILAGLAVCGLALLLRGRLQLTPRGIGVGAAVLAAGLLVLLVSPATLERMGGVAELLGNRLSFAEGSTSEHAAVMTRAWEVGTANVKQLLLGIGYGNSYLVLQDIYPGNRYGNFHSLFMTLLAESGVFAALLALVICCFPLLQPGGWRPLVAGFVVYNLFQQSQTDPTFWLVLTLAWFGVGDAPEGGALPPTISEPERSGEPVLATG